MDPNTRQNFAALVIFAGYCAAVALREIYSRPWQLGWFVGLVAAASCMLTIGYIYGTGHERRKRARMQRRLVERDR